MDVVFQLFWYPSNSCRIAGCNGWYCCTVLPFFSICCHFRGGIDLLEVLFYDCLQIRFRSSFSSLLRHLHALACLVWFLRWSLVSHSMPKISPSVYYCRQVFCHFCFCLQCLYPQRILNAKQIHKYVFHITHEKEIFLVCMTDHYLPILNYLICSTSEIV